jgi:hypothetical protein
MERQTPALAKPETRHPVDERQCPKVIAVQATPHIPFMDTQRQSVQIDYRLTRSGRNVVHWTGSAKRSLLVLSRQLREGSRAGRANVPAQPTEYKVRARPDAVSGKPAKVVERRGVVVSHWA